jgi:hypothetical protein
MGDPHAFRPKPSMPTRSARQAVVVACLSLAGMTTLAHDEGSRSDLERLAFAWDALSPSQQQHVCEVIAESGVDAAARRVWPGTRRRLSDESAEQFLEGVSCHIQVRIGTGSHA